MKFNFGGVERYFDVDIDYDGGDDDAMTSVKTITLAYIPFFGV